MKNIKWGQVIVVFIAIILFGFSYTIGYNQNNDDSWKSKYYEIESNYKSDETRFTMSFNTMCNRYNQALDILKNYQKVDASSYCETLK